MAPGMLLTGLAGLPVLALLALWPCTPARASDPSPAIDPVGFVGFASSRAPGSLHFDGQLATVQSYEPLRGPSGTPPVVRARLGQHLRARLGLGGRASLSLSQPLVLAQSGASGVGGLSDGQLALAVRALGGATDVFGETPEGAGLSLDLASTLPWGRSETLTSADKPDINVGLVADVRAFDLVAGGRLEYRRRLGSHAVALAKDRLGLRLGLQVPLPMLSRLAPERLREHGVFELAAATDPRHPFGGQADGSVELELRGMLRYRLGDWAVSFGGSAGLVRALDTPRGSMFVSLHYAAGARDRDADTVPDGRDACPLLTEDFDGFEDSDGCPEPDNDADGILDEDDLCPLDAADYELDEDEDGCIDRA